MDDSSSLASMSTQLTLSTCIVDVDTMPDHIRVNLAGDLDMADADEVGEILADAAAAGKPMVRVRLSDLKFADSSAIKAILIGAKAADQHGVGYELVNPCGPVQRLLDVTGLTMALTIVNVSPDGNGSSSH